jgi:hypothetical protein
MTAIIKNVDLNDGTTNTFDDWETCAASAFNVAVYTGNWFAAYSVDNGSTFQSMDPWGLCAAHGETLCCDQVVIYIPRINQFAWLLQTAAGNYVLAVASPQEIESSHGTSWASWLIPANRFGVSGAQADYPEVAVGDNYLYVTFNLIGNHSIGLRLSLAEIHARGSLFLIYFAASSNYWMRPVQSTESTGYFVAENSASQLRVFAWPERADVINYFDVDIATIPTDDFPTPMPSGGQWLGPTSKVDWHIYGATRTGSHIWVAWNGARKISGQTSNTFDYPHIGIAIIDVHSKKLVEQRYIWNHEHGFAWPSLATNAYGDVGLSFCWGGNRWDPQYGVAVLTDPDDTFVSATGGKTAGAGGHYTSVREEFPDVDRFCGAGFNQILPTGTDQGVNHPHYVLFKRSR